MKKHQSRLGTVIKALCLLSVISVSEVYGASLDDVLGVRSSTTVEGAKSQAKIDEVSEQTRDLLQQFKTVMKVVDGLRVYNQQQRRLIKNQEDELSELEESIDNVTVIERQIGPLIEKMIDNLEKFVDLDIPFLISERRERIDFLKDTLDRADVSVAEKFSQVLQAYQVENTYGTTIEAYTDVIQLEGKSRQVDMLKWGRVSLVFQTPDLESTGVWNNETRAWDMLADEFRTGVRDGLRIARKTQTADLVHLPVSAPGE
jgi:predicted RNase H-like nuclease (RuvC/YqgF family)